VTGKLSSLLHNSNKIKKMLVGIVGMELVGE
jgi:hypothetical protein